MPAIDSSGDLNGCALRKGPLQSSSFGDESSFIQQQKVCTEMPMIKTDLFSVILTFAVIKLLLPICHNRKKHHRRIFHRIVAGICLVPFDAILYFVLLRFPVNPRVCISFEYRILDIYFYHLCFYLGCNQ